jgi:hypothetical protein
MMEGGSDESSDVSAKKKKKKSKKGKKGKKAKDSDESSDSVAVFDRGQSQQRNVRGSSMDVEQGAVGGAKPKSPQKIQVEILTALSSSINPSYDPQDLVKRKKVPIQSLEEHEL